MWHGIFWESKTSYIEIKIVNLMINGSGKSVVSLIICIIIQDNRQPTSQTAGCDAYDVVSNRCVLHSNENLTMRIPENMLNSKINVILRH